MIFLTGVCGEKYERCAEELKKSCNNFNIDLKIIKYKDQGSWLKNARYKSKIILDNLMDSLVWLDADSTMVQYPELVINNSVDWGGVWWGESTLSGGTLLFNPSAKNLVTIWSKLCSEDSGYADDNILHMITNSKRDLRNRLPYIESNILRLPLSYSCEDIKNAVIFQRRASREK